MRSKIIIPTLRSNPDQGLLLGKCGGLLAKALLYLGVACILRMKHLDRNLAVDGQVLRQPNFTHASLAELADQAVVLDDGVGGQH